MKWISFDLDGTLMQNPFVGYVFPELEDIISKNINTDESVVDLLVAEHNHRMQQGKIVEAYDWDDIVQKLLKKYELSLQVNVEEIVIRHSVAPKIYLLDDDVINSLQYLKDKGYYLAVVTNGFYKYQAPVLKQLKIYDLFDLIVTPDRCGYAKPNAKILDEVRKKGQVVAHVGDRIDHDIVMANEEGIQSIFINRRLPSEVEKLTIDERIHWSGLKDFLLEKLRKELGQEVQWKETVLPNKIITNIAELKDIF